MTYDQSNSNDIFNSKYILDSTPASHQNVGCTHTTQADQSALKWKGPRGAWITTLLWRCNLIPVICSWHFAHKKHAATGSISDIWTHLSKWWELEWSDNRATPAQELELIAQLKHKNNKSQCVES